MVKIHATEEDRLIHMIATCRCMEELRSFWAHSQENPSIRHPLVKQAKDRRKAELEAMKPKKARAA